MFDWRDYLQQAQTLAAGPDEASFRSAISRAYYAAFHGASALLPEIERERIAKNESHKGMWDYFQGAREGIARSIGIKGNRLRQERKRADYIADTQVTQNQAKDAVASAMSLLSQLPQVGRITTSRF